MPGNPKGGCLPCRVVKETAIKVGENLKKNIKIYAFFAIILIEFFSIVFQNKIPNEVYAYKIYPTLVNIEFAFIFLAIFFHSERLRFCVRQKLIILFLIIYFLFNLITLLFPICWSDYSNIVNYSILGVITILFLATWKNL